MAQDSMAVRLAFEEQRSLAAASVTGTYAAVGIATLHPARMIVISNLTDADLQFSFDGTTDQFVISRRTSQVFDITSNACREGGFFLPKGSQLYVKEIENPTTGSVYFSVIYGEIL